MTPSIYCQSSDSILVSNSLCSYFSDLHVCPLGKIDYVAIYLKSNEYIAYIIIGGRRTETLPLFLLPRIGYLINFTGPRM